MKKKKKKMGRPSKYNKQLQSKFDRLVDSWKIAEYFKYGDVNQIALYLGICRDTVYDWATKHNDFSYTLKRWESKGRGYLFEISPTMAMDRQSFCIFLLKVKNGYIEKSAVEHSGEIKGEKSPQYHINFTPNPKNDGD